MVVRLIVALTLVLGAGCVDATQPAPSRSSGVATSGATSRPSPETTDRVDSSSPLGAVRRFALPPDPRGKWVARGPLSDGTVLISLVLNEPRATAAQLAGFVSDLAVFDPRDSSVRTLARPEAGTQAIAPIAAQGKVAWIEASSDDLRAYGWRIHLTDFRTGADAVAAQDDGVHPEGVSVLPAIAFDGSQLLFTRASQVAGEAVWQLHWLHDGRDTTVATLPHVRDQQMLTLAFDAGAIVWTENTVNPDPHETVGVFDIANNAVVARVRTALNAVYAVALTPTTIYFATGSGVFESSRSLAYEPRRFTPEQAAVDQIAIVGNFLIYRDYDRDETVAAIDIATRSRTRLAVHATYGPVRYQNAVLWYERGTADAGPRIAIVGF